MKKWHAVAGVALAATAMTVAPPAQAESYDIAGSSLATGFDMAGAWTLSGCKPELAKPAAQGGVSGIDSLIVKISGRAGQTLTANWSAAATVAPLVPSMYAQFYRADCTQIASPPGSFSTAPGRWVFQVPAGSTWMTVTPHGAVNIKLTY